MARPLALLALALALSLAGCNRGPAEEALAAAEQALDSAGPDLERYIPERRAALSGALAEARAALDDGRYTDSLRASLELSTAIRTAVDEARSRRAELEVAWEELASSVPDVLVRLRSRIRLLPVPTTLSGQTWVRGVQAEARALGRDWTEACTLVEGGDLSTAVKVGLEVGARGEALATTPGRATGPAAPAPSAPDGGNDGG